MNDDNLKTRQSVIQRLRNSDADADWARFYDLYAPLIHSFAMRSGCNAAFTGDVLQETMIVLARKLPDFEYDREKGSFRSWLLHIVYCRIVDLYRREKRYLHTEIELLEHATSVPSETEQYWEEQWRSNILSHSLRQLKCELTPTAYQIFDALVLQGRDVHQVASEHEMKTNAVYQQKHRVIKRLRQIAAEIEVEMGATP